MNNHVSEGKPGNSQQRDTLPEDTLPPQLTKLRCGLLWCSRVLMLIALLYLVYGCVQFFRHPNPIPESIYCSYLALVVFLSGFVSDFLILHPIRVHKARKEDRSEIEALIQEAEYVLPRIVNPMRPVDYEEKRGQITKEVKRLKKLGPESWTEYQVLMLERLLIDFLSLDDLKARAQSSLAELKEYAYGSAFSYDRELYYSWDKKIKSNISNIDEDDEETKDESIYLENKDRRADALRANLRSLQEHVADYQVNWARGSTIVSSIQICGSFSVAIFMVMGILPVFYLIQETTLLDFPLGILNWGILGAAGATASALNGLRNSDEVEVGNTRGKQELWRMVLGVPLGLVSGILVLSVLRGGLIAKGAAVPSFSHYHTSDVYLAIAWPVVAGMGLESVFQRVRSVVGL